MEERKKELLNTEIYNIGYDSLLTIMELCDIILDNDTDEYTTKKIINAIRKISIQSKLLMFNKDLERRRGTDN